jgi:hypothetical protein
MKSTHVPRSPAFSSAKPEKGNTHATWPSTKKQESSTAKVNPPLSHE